MKRYKVSWTELKPVYHEAEIEAVGQNDAARRVKKRVLCEKLLEKADYH